MNKYFDVSDLAIPEYDALLERGAVIGKFRVDTYERSLDVEPTGDGLPARYLAVVHAPSGMLIAYIPAPVEKTGEAIEGLHDLLMVWHNSMLDLRRRQSKAWAEFHEREIAVAGVTPRD